MQREVKQKLEAESLKASMCISAAYCIFVQHQFHPSLWGKELARFRLWRRPPGVPRRSAFGRTHSVGGQNSRSQTRWSSRKTTFPVHSQRQGELQMWAWSTAKEVWGKKEQKSEDDKLSPTCTRLSALAQVIVGILNFKTIRGVYVSGKRRKMP